MKLIFTEYSDHVQIEVMDGALRLHCYTVDNMAEARAFASGMQCAKQVASSLVQSLPMGYETKTVVPRRLATLDNSQ